MVAESSGSSEAVARRCSVKKAVLRSFAKFIGNRCFPVNFVKFLKTPFLTELLRWLLLELVFLHLLRSSRSQMHSKIDVVKIFLIFTGKHLC